MICSPLAAEQGREGSGRGRAREEWVEGIGIEEMVELGCGSPSGGARGEEMEEGIGPRFRLGGLLLGGPSGQRPGWAPLSILFLLENKPEKEKENKEKVGAESGHEDNFPGLIKICKVREN